MTSLVASKRTSTRTGTAFGCKVAARLGVAARREKIMPQGSGIRLDSYRLGEHGGSRAAVSYIYLGILSNMEDLKRKLNQENFEPHTRLHQTSDGSGSFRP